MDTQPSTTYRPGQSIFHLQTMLRTISFRHSVIPQLIPTGVFDEPTLEAVMIFQREFYHPVTGVVNFGTWEAIVALYLQSLAELAVPYPCPGYPFGDRTIDVGEESVHLLVIQAMFKALSSVLEDVEAGVVNGVHSNASVRNVNWLHSCDGCAPNGTITMETWNYLARLYRLFIAYAQTPWLTRPEVLNPAT